jgi:Lon protease-like protein
MKERPVQDDFPLFPLGIVALPSESVPLHVFEARYRTMIEQCLRSEQEFGIVWLSHEELKPVGCACAIEQVIERHDDGRLTILARGTRAFKLLSRRDDLPYPAGMVEFLRESEEEQDAEVSRAAHELYAELLEQATDRSIAEQELDAMGSYDMAATVDFGTDTKQELLELRSENARLRLLTRLFRAAIKQVEMVERAQARAHSNGKVHFG